MHHELENVRLATLKNNITWLKSFGCDVSWTDHVVYIEHSKLPNLNVRLVVAPPEKALESVEMILSQAETAPAMPEIYVDEASYGLAVHSRLQSRGFKKSAVNATKYNRWAPGSKETSISLRRAAPEDYEQWTSLYSAGFGHGGMETMLDRYQWQQSFERHDVHHWFLAHGNHHIGVCQTCVDNGVTGIYSLTLNPAARGTNKLRPFIRALQAQLTEGGEVSVYFERLWKKGWSNKQHIADDPHGFTVIRKMIGYQLSG